MDLLRIFESFKVFAKEESDTAIGLIAFIFIGVGISVYISGVIEQIKPFILYIVVGVSILIFILWIIKRIIYTPIDEFSIAIAQFDLLIMDPKIEMTSEVERNLKKGIRNFVFNSLHFHQERLHLGKYIYILRLPKRVLINKKNAWKWCKKINANLIIWGESYYDGKILKIRPRFEFLREPPNRYYRKFKRQLNSFKSFELDISENPESGKSELADLLHYITYLGLMFQGIELTNSKKFEDAQECFSFLFRSMKKGMFGNRTLVDIYLASKFFHAQSFHKWGNYLLENDSEEKAKKFYQKSADSFFEEYKGIKLEEDDKDTILEDYFLYGVYLLVKKGDRKLAEKKLDSMKKRFKDHERYLYFLYKGIIQKDIKKAERFFDSALKIAGKNNIICYEKIADYFYSNGKFNQASKYFEKKLKLSKTQIYNPELLEEEDHRTLSDAYLKELHLVKAVRERIIAYINKQKNESKKEHYLSE